MGVKLFLATLLGLSLAAALHFEPAAGRTPLGAQTSERRERPRLKLMTWNIGYAALEEDTRAHTADLAAVAETIRKQDPDVVALQELTGEQQLSVLLNHLGGDYRGQVGRGNGGDRVEAVLTKNRGARFANIPTRRADAVGVIFNPGGTPQAREVVFVSAHADAYSAIRRRHYTEEVVEWAAGRAGRGAVVLIAGDFNFELNSTKETSFYTDNVKHDSEAYNYLLRFFRDFGRDAGDTAINERRIDYIFGPPETATLVRAEVLRGAAVGRMDHWPLVVEVEL